MARFRKIPAVIEATQWFKNGDHPLDNCHTIDTNPPFLSEGQIVRYFRRPGVRGKEICLHCKQLMHHHGWIDESRNNGVEYTVCPGDWVITSEGFYWACHPVAFEEQFEALHHVHEWDNLLTSSKKTSRDKALVAALTILSTQHDEYFEEYSFSHLTPGECFEKLAAYYDTLEKSAA